MLTMMPKNIEIVAIVFFSSFPRLTRYVNDVHLPRFGFVSASRRDGDGTDGPYTEQPPVSKVPHGDSKDFSPSNAWNDSKTAVLRQLPRSAENANSAIDFAATVLL